MEEVKTRRRKSMLRKFKDDVKGHRPRIAAVNRTWLMERRKEYFKTNKDFAEAMGISQTQMSRRMTGRDAWSNDLMLKFCSLCHVTPEMFLLYTTEEGEKQREAIVEAQLKRKLFDKAKFEQEQRDQLINSIKLN